LFSINFIDRCYTLNSNVSFVKFFDILEVK